MRAFTTAATAFTLLLVLAGCSNDPSPEASGPETPPQSAATANASAELAKTLDITAGDPRQLLAEDGVYSFYAIVSDTPEQNSVCAVIENVETSLTSTGCGGEIPGVTVQEPGVPAVEAKLIDNDYDAGRELAEGWRQLHPNLLVRS
ncbi:hypothetical protein KKR91_01535 [Arthrobacter jiangjiafuii]|uniref:Lipoprotein n=1 Tax=Arthrobacter jiangjiafuii TaxID=2817475 RepID=A0A975M5K4_9MICC|nr:hypothetical protein [Arthrobacter jiangjiafuii]MBP3044809.1 hypothetical protein [Arthrobacter jiangjiafuii]QWC10366.1 hypothetical protein KKR91_01535 [Arthrobacter jiangjiafuii]